MLIRLWEAGNAVFRIISEIVQDFFMVYRPNEIVKSLEHGSARDGAALYFKEQVFVVFAESDDWWLRSNGSILASQLLLGERHPYNSQLHLQHSDLLAQRLCKTLLMFSHSTDDLIGPEHP